jgi:glucose-6-phosphate isomerase
MDAFTISYAGAQADHQAVDMAALLVPTITSLQAVRQENAYAAPSAFVNTPFDIHAIKQVTLLAERIKTQRVALMVVIGIGGSNLGAYAVYQACAPLRKKNSVPLYFADTVDTDYIAHIVQQCENVLKQGNAITLVVISKSGTTTETIANFECFLLLLKKYCPQKLHQHVVAITDQDSVLWQLAMKENFTVLKIPDVVGGRYSVFSASGLLPLACAGIDIQKLCLGAQQMINTCLQPTVDKNPAAMSAAMIAYHYQKKEIQVHDLFLFSIYLEGIGKWYRQLMGESLGKEYDLNHKQVHVGITPTVSIGSTDLHSVGQLYLGGPYDKFTTLVTVAHSHARVMVPDLPAYETLVAKIQGKSLSSIMQAIIDGLQEAYQQSKRPYMHITLDRLDEHCLGQFLAFAMIQMVYLGTLLHVNPFDQPQVELYKKNTKRILANE